MSVDPQPARHRPLSERTTTGSAAQVPPWLFRALLLVVWVVTLAAVAWWLFVQLQGLLLLLLISLFLALALEPAVNWLHRHRWPRGLATGVVMLAAAGTLVLFLTVLGSMLVGQVVAFVSELPRMARSLLAWVNATFHTDFSPTTLLSELTSVSGLVEEYASQLAGNVVGAGSTVLALLFDGLTIVLFTFYLCADGPRFRRMICSVLPPRTQREVLRAWEIAIEKTGGYIYSRALLALICAVAHYIVLVILDIPFAFALALWMGVLSQFIPTVGTYIGGALPVLVALLDGFWPALWVLVFVTVYQQFENYLLQPRITATTLDMHPAVAFGSVLAGVAILGAPGALLALPLGQACRPSSVSTSGATRWPNIHCWASRRMGRRWSSRLRLDQPPTLQTPRRPRLTHRTQQTRANRNRKSAIYPSRAPRFKRYKPTRGARGSFWTPVETVCRNLLVKSVPPRGRLIAYSLVGGGRGDETGVDRPVL